MYSCQPTVAKWH